MTKIMNKMIIKKVTLVSMALTMTIGSVFVLSSEAIAAKPHEVKVTKNNDVFSAGDAKKKSYKKIQAIKDAPNSVAAAGAFSFSSKDSPALRWFEAMDTIVVKNRKTVHERTILTRDFKQDAERIQEWIATAANVSSRYKKLSAKLMTLDIPEGHEDIGDYVRILSGYYADTAEIYEDLIRPRKPSKTLDDLEERLASIKSRSKSVKTTGNHLQDLDVSLRKKYKVHRRRADDALQQYVFGRSQ